MSSEPSISSEHEGSFVTFLLHEADKQALSNQASASHQNPQEPARTQTPSQCGSHMSWEWSETYRRDDWEPISRPNQPRDDWGSQSQAAPMQVDTPDPEHTEPKPTKRQKVKEAYQARQIFEGRPVAGPGRICNMCGDQDSFFPSQSQTRTHTLGRLYTLLFSNSVHR